MSGDLVLTGSAGSTFRSALNTPTSSSIGTMSVALSEGEYAVQVVIPFVHDLPVASE